MPPNGRGERGSRPEVVPSEATGGVVRGGVIGMNSSRIAERLCSISQRPGSTTTYRNDCSCRSPSLSSQGATHKRRMRGAGAKCCAVA